MFHINVDALELLKQRFKRSNEWEKLSKTKRGQIYEMGLREGLREAYSYILAERQWVASGKPVVINNALSNRALEELSQ